MILLVSHQPFGIESAIRSKIDKYLRFHNLSHTIINEAYDSETDTNTVTVTFNRRPDHIIQGVIGRIWLASPKNAKQYVSYDEGTNAMTVRITNYKLRQTIYETVAKMAVVHEFSKVSDGFKVICSPRSKRVDLLYDDLKKLRAIRIPGVSCVADVRQIVEHSKSKLIIRVEAYHQPH